MTDKFADIRARLEAVARYPWADPEHKENAEYFGDWFDVGGVLIPDDTPADHGVATFIRHAAEDIQRLLEALDQEGGQR